MGEPGRLGKYELIKCLGEGAMGTLYLAHDPFLARNVAIKLISREFSDPGVRELFLREARAAGALKHPNVVRVFDLDLAGAQVFVVMEYIAGETLQSMIDRYAPLSLGDRLQMFDQVCAALSSAHKSEWVHRAVRASNVMHDEEDGFIKLLIGSPARIAPEQIRGERTDRYTDIFAAGVLLYELLTYQRAFPGTTDDEIAAAVLDSEPHPMTSFVPVLPPELDRAMRKAIAKDPQARYADIESFRDAVRALAPAVADAEKIHDGETRSLSGLINTRRSTN
jgi:eukaryotic-like serine/threonine-protein kinase